MTLPNSTPSNLYRPALAFFVAAAMLAGCFEEKKTAVSYTAYNHTDRSIVSIVVNGEGGILNVGSYGGGGGDLCCVVIPNKWRPGLEATIKWAEDGDWLLDEHGREVIRDGIRVYVPRPYKEKTVEIPEYDRQLGRVNIHFFANDDVKVVVNMYGPGHSNYPFHAPAQRRETAREATK